MSCNGCSLRMLKKRYGKRLIRINNAWYLRNASPLSGQGLPLTHDGEPIRFMAWFMSEEHSNDEDCQLPGGLHRQP